MKILYGVQGTGNGHISRARVMASHFANKGCEVDYFFSGRAVEQYFAMDQFSLQQPPMYKRGFTFQTKAGKIQQFETIKHNNLWEFYHEVKQLDLSAYDVVINDFEPVSAWAAKMQKVASIGIGHQYAFLHDIPLDGHNVFTHNLMRYFAPVKHAIGLHWHHFNQPILPPIIDTSLKAAPVSERKILVYLPFEDQALLTKILSCLPQAQFYQYGHTLTDLDLGNVHTRKPSLSGFKQDLMQAHGVISNAGFELLSECIHIGLAMLIKPIAGQMEQESNAKALRQLGYASAMTTLDKTTIDQWLNQELTATAKPLPDVADKLTDWVIAGNWQDHKALMKQLW